MRKLNNVNKVTKEVTTSYEVAKNWKEKDIFFTDVPAPKGSEEIKENEKAKNANIGKIGKFVNGVTHRWFF